MSIPGPFGGGNPFEGLFGELAKLFSGQGPVNLDMARQMAQWLAVGGQPEANVDPIERIRFDELLRVADLHVAQATGLATSVTGGLLHTRAVGRGQWASLTLDAYRPLLEGLAAGLTATGDGDGDAGDAGAGDRDPTAEFLGGVTQMVGPLLLGMQSGSMVGHLATHSFGQYDLPIPRPPSDELLVVPANVTTFATDWSLPLDDVRLWICLTEVTSHAVLGRPQVRERLGRLLNEYTRGFRPDPSALEQRLASFDPSDPTSLQAAIGDPTELLGVMQTAEQRQLLARIAALVAALVGYVDHVVDGAGARLLTSPEALSEARRRRRVERNEGERVVERLFGLELGQDQFERGATFVNGVVERAGEDGLARLWHSARELPTPAEVDAPGLWLERIDIPD
ncbi:MAG: zinc-dependent metalloprotease [Acidimicrobiales bacterium]